MNELDETRRNLADFIRAADPYLDEFVLIGGFCPWAYRHALAVRPPRRPPPSCAGA